MPARKTKRADGRYQATAFLGYDGNGKAIRKYFYGESQKEANAKKRDYLDGKMLLSDAGRMTLSRWADIWLETYATGGYRNKVNKASIIRRFLSVNDGNMILQQVKPAHIQAYARSQVSFTKSHVDKVRRTIAKMFEAAKENGYILTSPCTGTVWESVKTGTHDMIDPWQMELIADNWRIHPAGTWAMLMLYAGLRPSEAFAMHRENIGDNLIRVTDGSHFEHGQLVIVPDQVKSEAGQREIPISAPLRPVVEALPAEGLVCLSARGEPVSEAAMRSNWKAFWNMLEDIYNGRTPCGAGRRTDRFPEDWRHLPKVRMYDLRHTFCSILYDAEVDVKTAQYLMGHASLELTLKIYTHLSEVKKKRSYDKLLQYLEK